MRMLCNMLLLCVGMKYSYQRTNTCGNIQCVVEAVGCKDKNGTQVCNCFIGVSGDACEIDRDECTEHVRSPCGHRGRCVNSFESYTCHCLRGWEGLTCRHRPSTEPDFDCFPGWEGKFCMYDIDECTCLPTPCSRPHEHCVNTEGSYNCICNLGWQGSDCMEDVDECVNNPCMDNETCQNSPGSYNCTLHVESGKSTGEGIWSTSTVIIISCFSGVLVLLVIIVVTIVFVNGGKTRKHRTQPDVNTEEHS